MFEAGAYYRSRHQHFSHSLDEEFEEPLTIYDGTACCCEAVESRSTCIGGESDHSYVILRFVDPRDDNNKILRFGFFYSSPELGTTYTKIDEPLVVLALAGAGLAP